MNYQKNISTREQKNQILKKLVRSEMSKEQWDKTVARYSDREIYKVITENIGGELHSWVYFREGK